MPIIRVEMFDGRTIDQKKELKQLLVVLAMEQLLR